MSASHDDHGHDDHGHGHSPWIQHHYDDAQHQFDSGKLGIWLFLAQEVLFFSALFVAYILYRHHHPEIYAYAHKYLDVKYGAINTAVLIFSSLTAAWAVRAAQLRQQKLLIACLATTIVCAVTFLGIKYIEYTHKIHEHLLFGEKFDPCISPNESPLLTKNNECPGSKGSVVWNYDKKSPEIGCFPTFALDTKPREAGVQADCKVAESEMVKIADDKGEPVINPDTKTALFATPVKSTPIAKQCEEHGGEGGHGGEACWKLSHQPAVCRPGWFYAMRCTGGDAHLANKEYKDNVGKAAPKAWKQYGPFAVAPKGTLKVALLDGSGVKLYARKGEAPSDKDNGFDPTCKGDTTECTFSGYAKVYVGVLGVTEPGTYRLEVTYDGISGMAVAELDYGNAMKVFEAGAAKDPAAFAAAKKLLPDAFIASRCDATEQYSFSQWFGAKGECEAGRAKRDGALKAIRDAEVELMCPKTLDKERDACIKALDAKLLTEYSIGECVRSDQVGVVIEHHDHEVRPASIAATASCKAPDKPKPDGDVYADKEHTLQVGAKSASASQAAHDDHEARYAGPPPEHTNMFFTIYFAMTGLHGIHVLVGVFIFIWLLIRAIKGHFTPEYFGPVDWAALYWHIVDLIWIFLFPLMYLIH